MNIVCAAQKMTSSVTVPVYYSSVVSMRVLSSCAVHLKDRTRYANYGEGAETKVVLL